MDERSDGGGELLIEGAAVLPSAAGEWLGSAAVLARDGLVVEVGSASDLARRHPGAQRSVAPGCLVLPGLVNAHQHAEGVSTAQMGFADEPFEPSMVLMHSLPSVDPYLTTLYKSMLMLTSGVTAHVAQPLPVQARLRRRARRLPVRPRAGRSTPIARPASGRRSRPTGATGPTFVYDDDERFLAGPPGRPGGGRAAAGETAAASRTAPTSRRSASCTPASPATR